jgi:hypothetical protein
VTLTAYDPTGSIHIATADVPLSQNGNDFYVEISPLTMSDVYMARADLWVKWKVPYSQESYIDRYRMDCSGYVSYVWQLPVAANTVSLGNYAYEVELWDLMPGDAINDLEAENDGHVVIFAGWEDYDALAFWAYEENLGTRGASRGIRQLVWTGDSYSIPALYMDNVVFQRANY